MPPLQRGPLIWLGLLLLAWSLLGMTGRDAWQAEEARALGDILAWQAQAGPPVGATSPLHTWLAGLSGSLLAPWLPLQDGARLASGGLTLVTLLFTALAAHRLFGPGFAAAAALALMGAFGLLLRAHALLPGIVLLAGHALLLYGITLGREAPRAAAIAIGGGLAGLLLARGLPDLLAGLAISLLPLTSRDWRTPSYLRALALALATLTLLLAAWLAAMPSATHLAEWWRQASTWPEMRSPARLLSLLAWFAWPLWPLALWTIWHEHRRLRRVPALHPLLGATLVLLTLALMPGEFGDGGVLPVLLPLALLAAHGLDSLKRGAAQAFYWFGVLCFLFFALVFWVYFAAIEWGWPVRIAAHLHRLTPSYQAGSVSTEAIGVACGATLIWLVATPLFPRAKVRPVLVWAMGMALTWVLLSNLFKPWAETAWGYRPLITQLQLQLPPATCLNAQVDPAMAAMLRYHLGERTQVGDACPYVLRFETKARTDAEPGELVWAGHRPRYRHQHYRLYRRAD